MKNVTKTVAVALVLFGSAVGSASAEGRTGLSNFELGKLRLAYSTDRNQDGRITAEEVLLTRPDAFDRNGDGRLDARERGIALQQLRLRRLN